jgi:indolepyruvate ferredoxin oxidoreductase beta subunit
MKYPEETNCLIAGVGGQGTVLAARVLGAAAMLTGLDVRGSETIGMAQRGGSVTSHVRMGMGIASPLIPSASADVILAFEPGEALRVINFLKPGGVFIVCDRTVVPAVKGDYDGAAVAEWLKEYAGARVVSGKNIVKNCGAISINITLIGAAAALGAFPFGFDEIEATLAERLNAKFLAANMAALRYGASLIRE